MKKTILLALVAIAAVAQATQQTIVKKTGSEQIINVGTCSSPILGAASGIYQSSFPKVACVEYETYQADVQGSFWNSKETRVGSSALSYRLETQQMTVTDIDFSRTNSGDPGLDLIADAARAGIRSANVYSMCMSQAQMLRSVMVHVRQTKCGQQ